MVKFAKQYELQLVPEWSDKFCDYRRLKKLVKKIRLQNVIAQAQHGGGRASGGISIFHYHHDQSSPIKIHQSKLAPEEDGLQGGSDMPLVNYETILMGSLANDEDEKAFFRQLDQELNKVNHFFSDKEKEFVQRVDVLNKQLNHLTGLHKSISFDREYYPRHGHHTHLKKAPLFSVDLLSTLCRGYLCISQANGGVDVEPQSEDSSQRPLYQQINRNLSNASSTDQSDISDYINPLFAMSNHARVHHTSCYAHNPCSASPQELFSIDPDDRCVMGDSRTCAAHNHAADDDDNLLDNDIAMVRDQNDRTWFHHADHATNDVKDSRQATTDTTISIIGPKQDAQITNCSASSNQITKGNFTKRIGDRLKGFPDKLTGMLDIFDYRLTRASHISQITNQRETASSLLASAASSFRNTSFRLQLYGDDHRLPRSVSMAKIKDARKMLRIAFVEFYRGLGLLRTYSTLNMLAFTKILKKYDKVTGRQASFAYMNVVEKAYFNTSNKVIEMMDEVERLFVEQFAKDDEKKAMMLLRPIQHKASHTITFFLGLFSGCSLALMIAFVLLLHLQGLNHYKDGEEIYLQLTYHVFGMIFLALLHMYLYGWNVYAWRKARINYAFIFEFSSKTELRHREILLVCTGLSTFTLIALLCHLLLSYSMSTHLNVDIVPLITIVLLLLLLVCPFNICYRSSRMFFMNCIKRVVLSPFYKVVLADFFLADQLTSQLVEVKVCPSVRAHACLNNKWGVPEVHFQHVTALRFFQFVLCYYFGGYFQRHNMGACGSNEFRFLAYLISFMPYWWRLMQCMRRYLDEGGEAHISNGGKYLSAMVAAAARISYSYYPTSVWLVIFVITSSLATVYQMYWDVVRDWGFFQPKSRNPWLRDQLILKNKTTYYLSIALNFVLRFAWVQQVVPWQIQKFDRYGTDLFFAAVEVIRRGHWNFYRLENEHLNNVGKYRATKLVPLPFRDDDESHRT